MKKQVWQPMTELENTPRAVALGVFDGVHIGHRAVIASARNVQASATEKCPTVTVFSLCGVPKSGGRLCTDAREEALAETLGVDEWLSVPFEAVREETPEQFVSEILYKKLQATVVCCGYNFRFGKNGAGSVETLKQLCGELGIEVRVVPAVEVEGTPVSTTEIRRALAAGDPARVMRLLGRPYEVTFPVAHGNGNGCNFGYPTANQPFPQGAEIPRFGVYASLVVIDGVQYRAITNVGVHPTVGDTDTPQAETYIFGYQGDLYDRTLWVQLIRFLREERRFDSVDALKRQIAEDVAAAEALFNGGEGAKAILFDFDDTLQHRPHAFWNTVMEMLKRYNVGLSEEEYERRAAWMLEKNNHGYVNYFKYMAMVREAFEWEISSEDMVTEFRVRFPFYSELYDDAVAVLCELRRRGYRLGVITNGEIPQQNLKIDYAGIQCLLDALAVAGEEGVNKPNPEIFRRVAERLCVSPQNCVFVGDYPPTDIVGAQGAGMTPLFIDFHGRKNCPEGVEEIKTLTELLDRF